jgi:hypothetical protein
MEITRGAKRNISYTVKKQQLSLQGTYGMVYQDISRYSRWTV